MTLKKTLNYFLFCASVISHPIVCDKDLGKLAKKNIFILPDRLCNWTLTVQHGCHLHTAHVSIAHTFLSNVLNLLPLQTVPSLYWSSVWGYLYCNRTELSKIDAGMITTVKSKKTEHWILIKTFGLANIRFCSLPDFWSQSSCQNGQGNLWSVLSW